jgi:hypothetical protein
MHSRPYEKRLESQKRTFYFFNYDKVRKFLEKSRNRRNLLIEGGALVDVSYLREYTEYEAMAAFTRVAAQHGWLY